MARFSRGSKTKSPPSEWVCPHAFVGGQRLRGEKNRTAAQGGERNAKHLCSSGRLASGYAAWRVAFAFVFLQTSCDRPTFWPRPMPLSSDRREQRVARRALFPPR